jgi:hypothetical protein
MVQTANLTRCIISLPSLFGLFSVMLLLFIVMITFPLKAGSLPAVPGVWHDYFSFAWW